MGGIFLSFLHLCLYCACIVLIAFAIVWILRSVFKITIDGEVYKWGKIVVALLIIIAVAGWLLSIAGFGGGPVYFPSY